MQENKTDSQQCYSKIIKKSIIFHPYYIYYVERMKLGVDTEFKTKNQHNMSLHIK